MTTAKRKLGTMLLLAACAASACLIGRPTAVGQDQAAAGSAPSPPLGGAGCSASMDVYFSEEAWAKVGALSCVKCHKTGGDAEESAFLLRDPSRSTAAMQAEDMRRNCEAFARMAKLKEGGRSRLLRKAAGELEHGGEEVLKPDSTGYRVLADFVRRVDAPRTDAVVAEAADENSPPFFEGVVMLDDRRLLRRVALSLAGRLPTEAESAGIAKQGLKGMPEILDAVMKEDAFYDRLREGFEDVFLTRGTPDAPESALYYGYFQSRNWTSKHDLSHIADEKERREARYKLSRDYQQALLGEPMKLIEHIVRNDRPFTEIVTADYIMVTPYSARGYGVYEELKSKFKNPDDPLEYVPVKLKMLTGWEGSNKGVMQESATGFYPHAGLLSTIQYLYRYPTTETNRNRLRARMYYQHFLGVDAMELAARVSDAAAVSAKFKVPTMEASECAVCHKSIDPVAGLYQDYTASLGEGFGGYGRRKGGWYSDMFGAGFEGEDLPAPERWRALQWLGERTAKDPRFAVAMVEHVYTILTGRKVLLPPKDLDDPLHDAKRRAYRAQRSQVETIAARFAANGFNLKGVFKDWILSDFYRADGLAAAVDDSRRRAELDDLGLARMLSPEQLERKVAAVFGKNWGRLSSSDRQLEMLYGGIDSKQVTERAASPSGAMGAIQQMMANDVACRNTALDFGRPAAERLLFPHVELDDLPGASPESDAKIRRTIVHLHSRVLGRDDALDSPEVERTYELFAGVVGDAASRKGLEPRETYHCSRSAGVAGRPDDPQYTLRAWRSVVTYLLRQHEFLYE